jgi:HK97 gp10 family phage protein
MTKTSVTLSGFKELEDVLVNEFPKATSKNVLKRTGMVAMKPLEARIKELAPERKGVLASSVKTQSVKAKRIKGSSRFETQKGVTIVTGPSSAKGADSAGGNAAWQEFGTVNMPANPYVRPAADSELPVVLGIVRTELALQIEKVRVRAAKKAAKINV